jgi:hypothetical protein
MQKNAKNRKNRHGILGKPEKSPRYFGKGANFPLTQKTGLGQRKNLSAAKRSG